MTDTEPPKTLYKYKPINEYTFASLINNTIYFPVAENLNDPFDSQLMYSVDDENIEDIIGSLYEDHRVPEGVNKNELERIFDVAKAALHNSLSEAHQKIGILSLTTKHDNTVMWTHYADSHKGICIEYDCDILKKHSEIIIRHMDYVDNLPSILKLFVGKAPKISIDDIAKAIFFYKHTTWTYESEWRILNSNPGNNYYSDSFIKSITFGCNTNPSIRDAICRLFKEKDVSLFEMKKINNKLDREPFSNTSIF